MITQADALYYIDPMPKPYNADQFPEGTKAFVIDAYVPRAETQPGSIVTVRRTTITHYNQYLVTTGGERLVIGHVLNDHRGLSYPSRRIAFLSDNLFALVSYQDSTSDGKVMLGQIQRLSDPAKPLNFNSQTYGTFPLTAPAAPWAVELLPMPGEAEDVVNAKLELAKTKWDQRHKSVALVREGLRREWTHLLQELRESHPRYMPEPRFDKFVEGRVLVPAGTQPTQEQINAANARLERNGSSIRATGVTNTPYVSVADSGLVQMEVTWDAAMDMRSVQPEFTALMRRKHGDHSLLAHVTNSSTVLHTVNF